MRPGDLPDDDALLARYAEPLGDVRQRWQLENGGYPHDRSGMLAIIKLNLLMDREPTDVVSAELMYEVVLRLAKLESQASKQES
jgi:hypothetical protein